MSNSKQRLQNQNQHINYSLPRVRSNPKVNPIIPFEESRNQIYGHQHHANTVGRAFGLGIGPIDSPRTLNYPNEADFRISVQDLRKTFDYGESARTTPTTPNAKSFPKSPSTPSFGGGQYNLRTPSPSTYRQSSPAGAGTLPRSFVFPPNKHSQSPGSGSSYRRFDPNAAQQTNSSSKSKSPAPEKLIPTPTGPNTFTYQLKPHSKSFLINEDEPLGPLALANYSPPPPISGGSGTIRSSNSSSSRSQTPFQNQNYNNSFGTSSRSTINTPTQGPNKPQRSNNNNNFFRDPIPNSWSNTTNNPMQMPLSNPFPYSSATSTVKNSQQSIVEASGSSSKKKSLYQNKPSILLTYNENQQVYNILGPNKQTLSTAVVQVFLPSETDRRKWKIRDIGVLCFVRDPTQRSYFLEILSLRMNRSILVQEIYEEFDYREPVARFLTFEGDRYCVGLSFANETEAEHFKEILDQKISAKRKRRYERQSKVFEQHNKQQQSMRSNSNNQNQPQNSRFDSPNPSDYDIFNTSGASIHKPIGFVSPAPVIHSNVLLHQSDSKSSKKKHKKSKIKDKDKPKKVKQGKKGKTVKIDKSLIGTPSNFQHISHAGFDSGTGFTTTGVFDEKMLQIIKEAGVSKKQLEDPATKQFIYEFVEDYERKSIKRAPPPPPNLTKTINSQPPRPAPNPIAPKQQPQPQRNHNYSNLDDTNHKPLAPAPPAPAPKNNAFIPPAPPMPMPGTTSKNTSSQFQNPTPHPPPPPPLPQINFQESNSYDEQSSGTAASTYIPPELNNDARFNLLDQIKQVDKGTLRKVDPNATLRKPIGGFSDLLMEIRSGDGHKSLRKVTESPTAARSLESMSSGGLAGALARALAERSHAINPESSDSDINDSINSDDEWGDD